MFRLKILVHIVSIALFLLSMVAIHVILNFSDNLNNKIDFFGILIPKSFAIDLSILLAGISFFIEFFLTFKPIKIKED